jgi:hypothetical protein
MGQVRKYRRSGPLAIHGGAVTNLDPLLETPVRLGLTDRLQ